MLTVNNKVHYYGVTSHCLTISGGTGYTPTAGCAAGSSFTYGSDGISSCFTSWSTAYSSLIDCWSDNGSSLTSGMIVAVGVLVRPMSVTITPAGSTSPMNGSFGHGTPTVTARNVSGSSLIAGNTGDSTPTAGSDDGDS